MALSLMITSLNTTISSIHTTAQYNYPSAIHITADNAFTETSLPL